MNHQTGDFGEGQGLLFGDEQQGQGGKLGQHGGSKKRIDLGGEDQYEEDIDGDLAMGQYGDGQVEQEFGKEDAGKEVVGTEED